MRLEQTETTDYKTFNQLLYDKSLNPELTKATEQYGQNLDARDGILKDISQLVNEMLLRRSKVSVKCQTDEAVWNGIP